MNSTRKFGLSMMGAGALLAAAGLAPAAAQGYNYVPGWADTHNHRYKGDGETKEWPATTELFAKLRSGGPAARCTLANLSEPDGNVIVNRYRSQVRKTNEQAALNWAHQQVAIHHRLLVRQGNARQWTIGRPEIARSGEGVTIGGLRANFMFDRIFQRAIGIAARLLFTASLVMVVWGGVYAMYVVIHFGTAGPTLLEQAGWVGASLSFLQSSFVPAAQLFCGSVIVRYLELWMAQRGGS